MTFRTNQPAIYDKSLFIFLGEQSSKRMKERIMIYFFLNVWQSIMNFFIKNGKNERSPYVDEQVINVPKEEMMKRIAEIVKKASEDD
mgnify:CR=1 FL=1